MRGCACVKAAGQHCGLGSLQTLYGAPGIELGELGLFSKCLYPLSLLVCLYFFFN